MFVPPFSNTEVSQIRGEFRRFFPEAEYSTEFFISGMYGESSFLVITDKKHKIMFEVTTLRSPKEEFNERTAKLVLMQRAIMQKDANCMNPFAFV